MPDDMGTEPIRKKRDTAPRKTVVFFSRVRYPAINEASASRSSAANNVADAIETGGNQQAGLARPGKPLIRGACP